MVTLLLLCFVACAVLSSLFFYLRTRNAFGRLKLEREAQALHKKYAERVAEVRGPVVVSGETIPLNSMEDLVKIADELGKPIFHQSAEGDQLYYVLDGTTRYQYTLVGEDN